MDNLTSYTKPSHEKLFKECGVFFAFNNEQFRKGCQEVGASRLNKIAKLGSGGYVLVKNMERLGAGMRTIRLAGIEQDIKENGIQAIIKRELENYEVIITHDISDTVQALDGYGIPEEQIRAGYQDIVNNYYN